MYECQEDHTFNGSTLEAFNKFLKANSNAFNNWFKRVFVVDEGNSVHHNFVLNTKVVNEDVINKQMIKGELNIDETDPDDGIVFLLGGADNLADGTFCWVIATSDGASEMLGRLRRNDKDAKKAMAKYQKIAQAKTKSLLSGPISKKVMTNAAAKETYDEIKRLGGNPLNATVKSAEKDFQKHQENTAEVLNEVSTGNNSQDVLPQINHNIKNNEPQEENSDQPQQDPNYGPLVYLNDVPAILNSLPNPKTREAISKQLSISEDCIKDIAKLYTSKRQSLKQIDIDRCVQLHRTGKPILYKKAATV
jgi:hypothetical protein